MTKAELPKKPAATAAVQSPIRKRPRSKRYVNRTMAYKAKNQQVKEQTDAMLAAARNKIKVSGLPRFYILNDPLLQSFLKTVKDDLKLNVVHTRFSKKGNAWLYLSFATEEEQIAALEKLKRFTWQGRTLISTLVTTDDLKIKEEDGAGDAKRQKIEIPLDEQVLMSQIPFYSIDYEEQLSKKHEEAHSLLARVRDLMVRQGSKPKEWCEKRCKELETDIPFALEKIRPCPMINEYRNKFDFVVGYKPHLETFGVGVRVKDADDGTLQVGPIEQLRNLPKPMIQLAKIFDGYINKDNHQHWLCFTVRKNSSEEYMVIAGATNIPKQTKFRGKPPANIKQETEEPAKPFDPKLLEQMKSDVAGLFKNVNFCKLKSIYLETERGRSKNDHDLHHLWGEKQIKEKLHNLEIAISPLTFYRQNSSGTEVLCSVVEELAGLTSETTLLDLFCGSGSLSLTLAKKCKKVIGVEVLESNLEDAKKNAELNGITNCEFIAGKIEDQIEKILTSLSDKEVVVVLDPPRNGIHAQIVKALRNFSSCKRFVYVCSNHKLPFRNLLDLSCVMPASNPKNKAFETDPFLPVKVVPVDMTPHSLRSELVIQCDRLPKVHFQSPEAPKAETAAKETQKQAQAKKKPVQQPKKLVPNRGERGMRGGRGTMRGAFPFRGGNRFNNGPPPRGQNLAPRGGGFGAGAGGSGGSLMNNPMIMSSIRDIERRAYEEGLVKGLERSAYQMGLEQGMNKPSQKFMDWEGPAERPEVDRPASNWSRGSNSRNWDSGNKWSSGAGSMNASNSGFRNSSGPSPWSTDFTQDVKPSFGSSSSSGFFSDRSLSRDWNTPNPSDFGFSNSRNSASASSKVWDSTPASKSSFGNSFSNSPWMKSGSSEFSSGAFNGESNRGMGRFNSSMNTSFGSFSSGGGFGSDSGFKSPPKPRGGMANRRGGSIANRSETGRGGAGARGGKPNFRGSNFNNNKRGTRGITKRTGGRGKF